ncbi:MAG: FkbM family methyltransferase [Planctomycetes bacterium]|nr:FkbM family methyltransferase [Planctomycetota bacterium]
MTKEPETLEWIGTFAQDDILWDIGANVGVYSLYAAKKGHRVLSFEPSPSNYYLISRNIELNGLDDRISAYCVAFNDESKLDTLFMSNTELGSALSTFGEETDWQGKPMSTALRQSMLGFSVDDFVRDFHPPFPGHIKLDVDGIENKILRGAPKTLADRRLKSVLVELDLERRDYLKEVTSLLEGAGLRLFRKEHAPECEQGPFSSVYNHIFTRPE